MTANGDTKNSAKTTRKRLPKLRLHKASGRGYVELNGRRFYLGAYGDPETERRYHERLAEWMAAGRQLPPDPEDLTVNDVLARFWTFAEGYYRLPDGQPAGELESYRRALRPLRALFGGTLAQDFGPLRLRAVREAMIDKGWCRTSVNREVSRVKRVFRWAVSEELIPSSVIHGLEAVQGLRRGRCAAKDLAPIRPVPEADVAAVLSRVNRQIGALIELQVATAARAGELVIMRPVDLDTSECTWSYEPVTHKTSHHGHDRTINLGPKAQKIIRPFLARPVNAFMFSPREAEAERREREHAARTTPLSYGNRPGSNRKKQPAREPGERYDVNAYRHAIHRACDAAGIERWSPHRLRHNAATDIRREYGLDAARAILGHRSAAMTEIYAELDMAKARDVIAKWG